MVASTFLMAAGVALGSYRGGALSWLGVALGLVSLVKALVKPSPRDRLVVGVGVAAWLLCWPGIFFYVLSVWEEGEVVELSIRVGEKTHRARTWIMEDADSPVVFYDSPASVTQAWIDAERIEVQRGQETAVFTPSTVPISRLSEDEVARVSDLVAQKYGELDFATNLLFGALGRSPDRTTLVIWLERTDDSS